MKLASKGATLVAQSARCHQLDVPVLDAIARRMQEAVPARADEDLSAMYLSSAPGRPPWPPAAD